MKNSILLFLISLPFLTTAQEHKDYLQIQKENGKLLAEIVKDDPAIENNLLIAEREVLDPITLSQAMESIVITELTAIIHIAKNSRPAGKVLCYLQSVTDLTIMAVIDEKSPNLIMYGFGLDESGGTVGIEIAFLKDQSVCIQFSDRRLNGWSRITLCTMYQIDQAIIIPFHLDEELMDVQFPLSTYKSSFDFLLAERQILQIIKEEKGKSLTVK